MLSKTKFPMIKLVFGIFLLNILHSQALFPDPKGHSQIRQRPGTFDDFTTQASIEIATETITRKDVELIKKSEKTSTKTKVLDKLVVNDGIKTTKTKDKTASLKTSTASKSTKNVKSESIVKKGGTSNGGVSHVIVKSENLNLDQTSLQGESIGGNRGLSIGREIKHGTLDTIDHASNMGTALDSSSVIVASKGSAVKTSLETNTEDLALERVKGGVIRSDEFSSAKGVKTTSIVSEAERVENIKAVHTDDIVLADSIKDGIKSVETHSSKGVKTSSITSEAEGLIADSAVLKDTKVETNVETESHSESVVKDSKVDIASSDLDSVEVKESDSLHTKAIKTVFVETEDEDKSQSEHLDVVAASKLTKEDHAQSNHEDDDEIAVLTGQKDRKVKEEVVKIRDESSHISTRTKVGPSSTKIDSERDSYAEKPVECCKRVLVSEKSWIEGDMTVMVRKYKTKGSLGQIIYSTETLRKTTKPIRIIGSVGGSTIYKASSSSSSSSSSSNGYNDYDYEEEDQVAPMPYPARGRQRGDLNIALDKMRAPSGDHSEWESAEGNSQNLGSQGISGTKTGHSSTVVRKKVTSFSSGGSIPSSHLGEHRSYGSDQTFENGDAHLDGSSSSIKTAKIEEHKKSTTQIKSRAFRSISNRKEVHTQDGYAKDINVRKVIKRDIDNHDAATSTPKESIISSNIEDRPQESFKDGDAHSESSSISIKTSEHKEHQKSSTQIKLRGIRSIANRFERHIDNYETGTKRPRPKRSDKMTTITIEKILSTISSQASIASSKIKSGAEKVGEKVSDAYSDASSTIIKKAKEKRFKRLIDAYEIVTKPRPKRSDTITTDTIEKILSTISSQASIAGSKIKSGAEKVGEKVSDAYSDGSSSIIKSAKGKRFKRHIDTYEIVTKPRPKRSDPITIGTIENILSTISSHASNAGSKIKVGAEKVGDAYSDGSSSIIKTANSKEHHKSSSQTKSREIRSMANRREAHALVDDASDSLVGKHFKRHIDNYETGTKRPRPKRSDKITTRTLTLPRKCGKIMLGTNELDETTKIVGGTEVRAGTWPWLVTFQHEGYHFCGGTIISDRHVISATHCFPDFMPPHNLTVNAGKHIKEGVVLPIEQHRKIKRLVKHVGFNRAGKFDNDIALVEVDLPFQFTEYIQPACLPGLNEKIDPKAKCCVAGFGDTRKTANDDVMNELCVPLLPRNLCNSTEFYNGRLTSTMMCAGFEDGKKDSCKGDSGGPLICNIRGVFKLFGITSWGEDCAKPKRPGLYTDISLFQNWIRENL